MLNSINVTFIISKKIYNGALTLVGPHKVLNVVFYTGEHAESSAEECGGWRARVEVKYFRC